MIHLQIYENAGKCWRKDGLCHRDNGPAVCWPNGDHEWWVNGNIHRLNGPARIWGNDIFGSNNIEWWKNGVVHRLNGPAITRPSGAVEYWIDGNYVTEYELMFLSHQVKTI